MGRETGRGCRMSKYRRRKAQRTLGDFPLAVGKYAGRPIRSVPHDYLQWILRAKGFPSADKWIVRKWLREGGAR